MREEEKRYLQDKFANRNIMEELLWCSEYSVPWRRDDQDYIRWMAMTAYDTIIALKKGKTNVSNE